MMHEGLETIREINESLDVMETGLKTFATGYSGTLDW